MTAGEGGTLEDLLRRCHRDELVPLARQLGVRESQGLGALAGGCARTLRRRGGNDLWNLVFRSSEGPPYPEVVHALAQRCGVAPGSDVADTETALLSWWMEREWARLDPAARARLWSHLRLGAPVPDDASEAVRRAKGDLGGSFGYATAVTLLGGAARLLVLTPLAPVAWIAWLHWLARPRDDVLLPAVLEVARLRQIVRHRVTVGVVGSPSAGKDAAIDAIFGIRTGNVHPVAGSTREVEIRRLEGSTALYVVNTPGMGDVVEAVTEEARQVLDHIDVFVYVVNAQGGVQARELADWRGCRARGRPVLAVVNKVDTLRPADRDRFLDDARAKLGAPDADFLAAAFDPLPQLSETPIGVEPVRAWITEHLVALGKDPSELPWERSSAALAGPAPGG